MKLNGVDLLEGFPALTDVSVEVDRVKITISWEMPVCGDATLAIQATVPIYETVEQLTLSCRVGWARSEIWIGKNKYEATYEQR